MEVSNLKDISGSEFKKYIKNSYNEMSILEFNNLLNFISYNCNSYNELLKFEELLGIYLMSDKKIESYVSVFDAFILMMLTILQHLTQFLWKMVRFLLLLIRQRLKMLMKS